MSIKTKAQLKAGTDAIIKVNGNREITPPLDNSLRTDLIDSMLNIVDGGNVIVALTGYTTDLTPSDNKHFTPKKYVDDSIAASTYDDTPVFYLDGSRDLTGSANFANAETGITWDSTGNSIKDDYGNIIFTAGGFDFKEGGVSVYDGSLTFQTDLQGLAWSLGGSSIRENGGVLSLSSGGNINFVATGLSASTVVYLDASKNLVSLANSDGVLTNTGGVLSWSASGGIPTQITVANEATDTTCFPLFVTAATGDLAPKTNANFTFNSNTGVVTLVSPSVTTSLTTGSTTFSLVDTTATTVNFAGGASTALNIGHSSGTNTLLGTTRLTNISLLDTTYKSALDVSAANALRIGNGFTSLVVPGTISRSGSITMSTGGDFTVSTPSGQGLVVSKTSNNSAGDLYGFKSLGTVSTSGTATYSGYVGANTIIATSSGYIALFNADPSTITSHSGDLYGFRSNIASATNRFNIRVTGTAPSKFDSPILYPSYTVVQANALTAAGGKVEGATIYVNDESGGKVLAFYDGTNWCRVTDRATIS
jgi:hypothetical protein